MVATGRPSSTLTDWAALSDAFRETAQAGELDAFRSRRWQYADDPAGWLEQDALATLTQSPGRRPLSRRPADAKSTSSAPIPSQKSGDAVDFLLYDTIKLENRFEECALETGGFGLAGAGREWPSYLLTLREPTLFAPWSPHTERALRRLGLLPPGLKQGHPGLCYIDLLDAMQILRVQLGVPDFRAVDEFCYFNGRVSRATA